MNIRSRINSIIKAPLLDDSTTGFPTFDLSELNVNNNSIFQIPTKLRLGHLVEKIVSELIKSSSNYKVLHENLQIFEDKKTIGEVDFLIKEINTQQITHLELVYKFYLFDPKHSPELKKCWIAPNRNDSLVKKLDRLKENDFPLLYHDQTKSLLKDIEIDQVTQALCLFVSLYIPYEFKGNFSPIITNAIKGFYLNHKIFNNLDHSNKKYYLPIKTEWGMDPSANETWTSIEVMEELIDRNMKQKRAILCWQKNKDSYLSFFIVWW